MAKISGKCVCDNSKAGTDGHKQNLACRPTMKRGGDCLCESSLMLNLLVDTGPLFTKEAATEKHRKQEWMEDAHKVDIPSHGPPNKPQSKH